MQTWRERKEKYVRHLQETRKLWIKTDTNTRHIWLHPHSPLFWCTSVQNLMLSPASEITATQFYSYPGDRNELKRDFLISSYNYVVGWKLILSCKLCIFGGRRAWLPWVGVVFTGCLKRCVRAHVVSFALLMLFLRYLESFLMGWRPLCNPRQSAGKLLP